MENLAILTPTYNRADLLPRAYNALVGQTNKNFVWYIIDDGSKDNTEDVVSEFIKDNLISIKYVKKENGGKHTALNVGINMIEEPILVIVDSDDYLTNDAVETILSNYAVIKDDSNICGIGYLKGNIDNKVVGKLYTKNCCVDSFVNQRYNKNTYGDKSEVFKTDILKQFPFPEFKGESFLSEATVWATMSGKYKMLFINKIIYICDYQVGGLSDGVAKRLFKNPKGAKTCYKVLTGKGFNLKNKIKYTILYIVHSLADGDSRKQIISNSNNKMLCRLLYLPSKIIYNKRRKNFGK